MFWLAYFPIQEAPNIRQKLFGAALGRNRRENVAKHNSNKHNEIYHLGAEIGTRSDFFLQLVIHQKGSLSTFTMLKRNSAILLQHSAKSCSVFAIWFLSIAMSTILKSSMHFVGLKQSPLFFSKFAVLNCGITWLTPGCSTKGNVLKCHNFKISLCLTKMCFHADYDMRCVCSFQLIFYFIFSISPPLCSINRSPV